MRALLVFLVASALIAGCTPERRVPAPTASGTAAASPIGSPLAVYTAAPSATPRQTSVIATWDAPPQTGIAHLDAIVAAITERDAAALEPYVTGSARGCDGFTVPCPPGTSAGTPVHVIAEGVCDAADWVITDTPDNRGPETTRRGFAESVVGPASRLQRVIGIWRPRPGTLEDQSYRYVLVGAAPSGIARLWLDDHGVIARWDRTCGQAEDSVVARLQRTHSVVLAPPP